MFFTFTIVADDVDVYPDGTTIVLEGEDVGYTAECSETEPHDLEWLNDWNACITNQVPFTSVDVLEMDGTAATTGTFTISAECTLEHGSDSETLVIVAQTTGESEMTKILASDGNGYDDYGRDVDIEGDYAIVGGWANDDAGSASGSAYILVRTGSNWSEQTKILPSDGAAGDRFGWSVGVSGDYAVAGAPEEDDNGDGSGSAYVFLRDGESWSQQAKLAASDGAATDNFAYSIAIDDDCIVVGAYNDDDNGSNSGSAYVFARTGTSWDEETKLTASDGAANDKFGVSVAIDNDTVVVGAYGDDDYSSGSGSAYVFRRTGTNWGDSEQEAKLTASDPAGSDNFGWSVSIKGEVATIGAYNDDDNGSSSGSAYVFVRNGDTWTEKDKLTASDGTTADIFGTDVSVKEHAIVVGASGYNDNTGSAYVFLETGDGWQEASRLEASDGEAEDRFGGFVAVDGNYAIVGTQKDDDSGTNAGAAYIFDISQLALPEEEETKIYTDDGAAGDQLGYSVCIDGNSAIVGAPFDDDDGSSSGSAYVYVRSGNSWVEQTKLTASADGAADDYFGSAVFIDDDTAIVGAYGDDTGGSAYIFVRSGTSWSQETKLLASDSDSGDQFGCAVSVVGDLAVVGAKTADGTGLGVDAGAAYVFVRNGTDWSEEEILTASDQDEFDYFGNSVSINGDYAIIGALQENSHAGAAYVFVRSGTSWSEQTKLTAPDAAANDYFGKTVSIEDTYAIVGADENDDGGSASGSAYIYSRTGTNWSQQAKLTASDATAGDLLGSSVSIYDYLAVVGAKGYNDDAGLAYVFLRTGTSWSEVSKLQASDNADDDKFGFAVSVGDDYAIVGAPYDDKNGTNAGAAYMFDVSEILNEVITTASDAGQGDGFGESIAIDGNYAIVGAPGDDNSNGGDAGAAYILVHSDGNWSEQFKLIASDGAASDFLAVSCDISGDTAIVGTHFDDDYGDMSGSAYIFTRTGTSWSEQTKLTSSDSTTGEFFGYSAAIDGDYAVVGAFGNSDSSGWAGSAYVFARTGTVWSEQAKLIPSDPMSEAVFGCSVSIDDDTVAVGALEVNYKGAVYIFARNGESWSEQTKIIASDGEIHDAFGSSLSLEDDQILIGAFGDSDSGYWSGAAYVYVRNGSDWAEQAKLTASDSSPLSSFGKAVCISGDTAMIGAPGTTDNEGEDSGAVYIFKREGSTWDERYKLTAKGGTEADLYGNAVAVSDSSVLVGASGRDITSTGSGAAYIYDNEE